MKIVYAILIAEMLFIPAAIACDFVLVCSADDGCKQVLVCR